MDVHVHFQIYWRSFLYFTSYRLFTKTIEVLVWNRNFTYKLHQLKKELKATEKNSPAWCVDSDWGEDQSARKSTTGLRVLTDRIPVFERAEQSIVAFSSVKQNIFLFHLARKKVCGYKDCCKRFLLWICFRKMYELASHRCSRISPGRSP